MKTGSPSVVVVEFQCAVCGARLDQLHLDPGPGRSLICSFCGAPQPGRNGNGSGNGGPNGWRRLSLVETSDVLREARERRGESLDDVAGITGINPRYLEDLECGDASFEPYPGHVYGRFFLREYAEHLGLDPDPMVEAFDGEAGPIQPLEPTGRVSVRDPSRSSFPWSLVALIGLVLLLIGAAVVQEMGDDPPIPGPRIAASARSEVKPAFASKRPPAHEAPVRGIHAVLRVSGRCWIEATSDGETIFRATAEPGKVVKLRADRRLELTLGNAGGVDLFVNGRPAATRPSSTVAHLVFVLRGDEVKRSLA